MSKVRDLPEITILTDDDLFYVIDSSAGPNGGRKITRINLKTAVSLSALEVKTLYESNANTNAYTDTEKAKLATVQMNAAFQTAVQVPYTNTTSGLSATNVQDAIDQVNTLSQADFRPFIVSNRILGYSGGTARFDGVFFTVLGSDILLTANVTDGYVYVDLDGTVKQTGSSTLPPPYTIAIAKFTTDANNITALEDQRVKNAQNLVRGVLSDIDIVEAGEATYQGNTGRVADAGHSHGINTGAAVGLAPSSTNQEGSGPAIARAAHTHQISTALVADIAALSVGGSSSAGTSDNYVRGNHTHAVPRGTPVAIGSANADGTASSFAGSDHVHQGLHSIKANTGAQRFGDVSLKSGVGVTITDDGSGNFTADTVIGPNELYVTQGTGLIVNYTAGRVRINGTAYNISAGSIAVGISATNGRIYVDVDGTVKSTTATSTPPNAVPLAIYSSSDVAVTALADNRYLLGVNLTFGLNSDIVSLTPDLTAAAGSTNKYADAGHVHNIPTAAAIGLSANTTNTQGSTTNFARADHTHAIATGIVIGLTPDQANAAGTSANLARADHVHNIPTGVPSTLNATNANTQGSVAAFARQDHLHAISTGIVIGQSPDQANAAGTSANLARADHVHNIPTAAAISLSTSTSNTQGSTANFARADHTHAVSVTNNEVTATADDTATSATDILMNSMTSTPAAGTYLVMWSGSIVNSANGVERTWISLYLAGSQVSATERSIGTGGGSYNPAMTHAIVTVNGSQAVELRWRVAGGTSTVHSRRLSFMKLA